MIILAGVGCVWVGLLLLVAFWELREVVGIALILGFFVWSFCYMAKYLST